MNESITEGDMGRMFPLQTVKPMFNDPVCWGKICELAGVPELRDVLTIDALREMPEEVEAGAKAEASA